MKKRKIIIDTDPGIDDAVALAIALFSNQLDVQLLTTVVGNVSCEQVTDNLLKLLAFYNKKVPVAKGAITPLLRKAVDASDVHGDSGLDGFEFPEPTKKLLLKTHAIEEIAEVLDKAEGKITIVAIGPLTNIALLLRVYPHLKEKIEEIIIMGGSTGRGNKGVFSEFNFAVDPEAAKIVFESRIPLVMVGLDVGWKALITPEDTRIIKAMHPVGEMFYNLFQVYRSETFNQGLEMYDSCAIAYLLQPEMFTTVETFVAIETQGKLTAGASVVDLENYLQQPPNCKVCVDIDENIFKEWFIKELNNCH